MDKHMSEPMIITLTDLSLAVFCNCVGYLEILVKYVEFFMSYTVIVCFFNLTCSFDVFSLLFSCAFVSGCFLL